MGIRTIRILTRVRSATDQLLRSAAFAGTFEGRGPRHVAEDDLELLDGKAGRQLDLTRTHHTKNTLASPANRRRNARGEARTGFGLAMQCETKIWPACWGFFKYCNLKGKRKLGAKRAQW